MKILMPILSLLAVGLLLQSTADAATYERKGVYYGGTAYPFCYPFNINFGDPATVQGERDSAEGTCRSLSGRPSINNPVFSKSWSNKECAVMNRDGSVRTISYGFWVSKAICE